MLKCILEKYERVYVNWTEIAQDRVKKGAFVNTAIKLAVVVVEVYPLVPLGTLGICEASPSDPVACQPLTFTLCCHIFLLPKQSFSRFASVFLFFWLPVFQWLHPHSSRV